jgi:hypothetical protein
MSSQLYNKKQYKQLKFNILKCIKYINNLRNNKQRILGRKNDILSVIKIYKFYKKYCKLTNTNTLLQKVIASDIANTNANTLLRKVNPKEIASDIANTPQIIKKHGYQFIIINGMYHKLTKKTYTEKDMNAWYEGRLNASNKMKEIHALNREKFRNLASKRDKEIDIIYNREYTSYPQELREMMQNTQ